MAELFGMRQPIIGMVHLAALPGTPHAEPLTRRELLERALRDRDALLEAGFDAISISNEGDRPYVTEVDRATVALIAWLVGEITREVTVPFGCGVLLDPRASLAVARATGARFIRVSYGTEAGCFGLVEHAPGEILRYRAQIGAQDVGVLAGYSAHFSTSLDTRPLPELARTYTALHAPDAIQVYGAGAGAPPTLDAVAALRDAVPGVPVLVASGATAETIGDVLGVCDGVIVGTTLKRGGNTYNPIEPRRAQELMQRVREVRGF